MVEKQVQLRKGRSLPYFLKHYGTELYRRDAPFTWAVMHYSRNTAPGCCLFSGWSSRMVSDNTDTLLVA